MITVGPNLQMNTQDNALNEPEPVKRVQLCTSWPKSVIFMDFFSQAIPENEEEKNILLI